MLYLVFLVVLLILGFIIMGLGLGEGGVIKDGFIEGLGEGIMTIAGVGLLILLVAFPVLHSNNQDKIDRHQKLRELVVETKSNENIKMDPTFLESVKDSNEWLEEVKEANKGEFGLWVPNEVEKLEKIKL